MMPEWVSDLAVRALVFVALVIPFLVWFVWLRRHTYEAREDRICVGDNWHRIYVRDVCTHCGHTVERVDRMEQIAKLRLELGVDKLEKAHG